MKRRTILQIAGMSLGACLAQDLNAATALLQDKTKAPLNRFPRMVHESFVRQARQIDRRRRRAISRLSTRESAEVYIQGVRDKIATCFGPMPERTPLNPQVTHTINRDDYRIENIIFESRPGFPVTANLYLPKGEPARRPGVIGTCGHSVEGKAAEAYQSFAQGLARQGFVVLIYDPIGQGERLQYVGENGKSKVGPGVSEHLLAGNQQFLIGEFLGSWRAWDGVRALDYLQSRSEVNPNQIGVTGNSGGGTMTTWLCGVEPRWSMAAPSCFVTSFLRNLENELPADTEQCPPQALAMGLDHEDFLAAMAPKPVIILAQEGDYFDVRGSQAAHERLKKLYALLGAEDQIGLFIGPRGHGYSVENRVAMYQWFQRATDAKQTAVEPELTLEAEADLLCAPQGQVNNLSAKSVPMFTREISQSLGKSRGEPEPDELRKLVREHLRLEETAERPHYRILRPVGGRGYPLPHATPYAVESGEGVQAIVYGLYPQAHYSRPPRREGRALLFVSHQSADAELRDDPWLRERIVSDKERPIFAVDLRGIGESRPDTCGAGSFLQPYGSDYFYSIHSLMMDKPYVGQRTHDLMVVLNWLKSCGHAEVEIVARGWGAIPATFAAVLDPNVSKLTMKQGLTSYSAVAETEQYRWPLALFLPGVLRAFDLPDCYRVLGDARLEQLDMRGAEGPDPSL